MNELKKLINKRNLILLFFLLGGLILSGFLEMVGIGILPAFVLLIARPDQNFDTSPPLDFFVKILSDYEKTEIIFLSSIILVVFFILKNLYLIFLAYCEAKITKSITLDNSTRLFKGYMKSPYLLHVNKNPSELLRNLTETNENVSSFIQSLVAILKETFVVLFLFTLLVFTDFQVTLGIFSLLLVISSTFYLVVKNQVKKRGVISQNSRAEQIKLINQSLESIKYIKISHKENFFIQKYYQILNIMLKQSVFISVLSRTPRLFLEVLAILLILIVVSFFIYLDRSIYSMLPFLTLLTLVVVRLVPSFNTVTTAITSCGYNVIAIKTLYDEFEYIKKNTNNSPNYKKEDKANFVVKELSLNNVSFSYLGYKKLVLKDVSMTIKSGTTIAIVGPSGAGKSTLVDIILGLLKPTSGNLTVNGKPIAENIQNWYNQLGFVPQDIYLNDDSIKHNIAFAQNENEIDENQVNQALNLSKLNEYVKSLPDGINSFIGNRGIKLSGGQLQRLGIARCLYQNPNVLVMDEATSSLDYETERHIIQSINNIKKNRTVIIIAHRLSTIKNSDMIYYLRDGELVDKGNFEELEKRHTNFFSSK